jgi:hypothetical protein
MKDNFKIMEFPSDNTNTVRIAIPGPFPGEYRSGPAGGDETVTLEKFASADNFEFVRVGYSARANILVIKEVPLPKED